METLQIQAIWQLRLAQQLRHVAVDRHIVRLDVQAALPVTRNSKVMLLRCVLLENSALVF